MVTATTDQYLEGLPSVAVAFSGFAGGVHHQTLTRVVEGRTMPVRGGFEVAPDVTVRDFEAPFGVDYSYVSEMFDAGGGSVGYAQSDPLLVDVKRSYVHQPLNPNLWASPHVMLGSAEDIDRPLVGDVVYVEGDSLGRRIGSRRLGISGLDLVFETDTIDAANQMQRMLGDYETQQIGVLIIRTPPPLRIPRTLIASVRKMPEVNVNVNRRGSIIQFPMTVDETAGPHVGLVVPTLTYDDLDAAYGTYDIRDAAYPTTTDSDRDYSLAGYAGGS